MLGTQKLLRQGRFLWLKDDNFSGGCVNTWASSQISRNRARSRNRMGSKWKVIAADELLKFISNYKTDSQLISVPDRREVNMKMPRPPIFSGRPGNHFRRPTSARRSLRKVQWLPCRIEKTIFQSGSIAHRAQNDQCYLAQRTAQILPAGSRMRRPNNENSRKILLAPASLQFRKPLCWLPGPSAWGKIPQLHDGSRAYYNSAFLFTQRISIYQATCFHWSFDKKAIRHVDATKRFSLQ